MAPCLLLKSQNNSYSNHDCENPKIIDRKLPISGVLLRPMWCSSKLWADGWGIPVTRCLRKISTQPRMSRDIHKTQYKNCSNFKSCWCLLPAARSSACTSWPFQLVVPHALTLWACACAFQLSSYQKKHEKTWDLFLRQPVRMKEAVCLPHHTSSPSLWRKERMHSLPEGSGQNMQWNEMKCHSHHFTAHLGQQTTKFPLLH